ncbi:EAL domain-containing protein [Aliikangiella coralliicola]|uniref:EAL domain-containing protein n=1 Tax=Aliikangiella coralliicola TaxID=2592383 RepID=UPI00143D9A80|nr:EAL domain-containing protein [Aliikangiella coralliicola]
MTPAPLQIDDLNPVYPAGHIYYYEDLENRLTEKQIAQLPSEQWTRVSEDQINFGMTPNTFWYYLSVKNITNEKQSLYLHIDYALLDEIELFVIENNSVSPVFLTGDQLPFMSRPEKYTTYLFPMTIKSTQKKNMLIRVNTQGPMKVPISIWRQKSFFAEQLPDFILYGIFLGILLIMTGYHLFLFFSIRDPSYLYYSLFTLSIVGYFSSLYGVAYQWLWPESVYWHNKSTLFFNATGALALNIFTVQFFQLKKFPTLKKLVTALIASSLIMLILTFSVSYLIAAKIHAAGIITTAVGTFLIGLTLVINRVKAARFFLLSWSAFLFGTLLSALSTLGLLASSAYTENSGIIGAIVGVLLLSLAMADRIKEEQSEKEKAQNNAINNLERYHQLYENALEGIFTINGNGKIISANPKLVNSLGFINLESLKNKIAHINQLTTNPSDMRKLIKQIFSQKQVIDYEIQLISQDYRPFWGSVTARVAFDEQSNKRYVEGSLIDISARKISEERLKYLARHDPLTELFNRREFERQLKVAMEKIRQEKIKYTMLYLDLDQFKLVNDTCGHTAGDHLLKLLTGRLLKVLDGEHLLARLGGDEFGVLLKDCGEKEAMKVAEQLKSAIESFLFRWKEQNFTLGASIGLVELSPLQTSIERILSMADTACFMAKDQGRNRICVFTESDKDIQLRQHEMHWISTLTKALKSGSFFLSYQKIHNNIRPNAPLHYEILLRMKAQDGRIVSPASFLPAAERYNLAPSIDRWVIITYFQWLSSHPQHMQKLEVASINLSVSSIEEKSFKDFLIHAFNEYAIAPDKICFEITESMAITRLDNTIKFIKTFKSMGCHFALDDFGTGFSSYAYLKDLPVDYVKIDGFFVRNIVNDAVDLVMVKSINEVAQTIGIKTVAEYVESYEVQKLLQATGIEYSQGYYIHKPMILDDLIESTQRSNQFGHTSGII